MISKKKLITESSRKQKENNSKEVVAVFDFVFLRQPHERLPPWQSLNPWTVTLSSSCSEIGFSCHTLEIRKSESEKKYMSNNLFKQSCLCLFLGFSVQAGSWHELDINSHHVFYCFIKGKGLFSTAQDFDKYLSNIWYRLVKSIFLPKASIPWTNYIQAFICITCIRPWGQCENRH